MATDTPLDTPLPVALLGTGLMGAPMARNILQAGHALTVWNRSRSKAEPLQAHGARIAQTVEDAVREVQFVVTMLSDGTAVGEALQTIGPTMRKGAVLIDMSSIKPSEARAHAAMLEERGVDHIDAPVSGGTRGAEAATLAIMAGGTKDAFRRARPLLETMGRPTRVGGHGAGQTAKLANQTIVAITIGAVAEAMMLAEHGGADPDAVRAALAGGFADSVILQQHGARMSARDFEPGGLSTMQLKDLRNARDAAGDLDLPLTAQMTERFATLVEDMGKGRTDHSAIYLELLQRNGRGGA